MLYTIKEGKTKWEPRDGVRFFPYINEIVWVSHAKESMKTDKSGSWNYIGGISFANFANFFNLFISNRDSIIKVWRYLPEEDRFEYSVLEFIGGIMYSVSSIKLNELQEVEFRIRKLPGGYKISLKETLNPINGFEYNTTTRFNPILFSKIGMKYTDKAPKDMEMEVAFLNIPPTIV